MGPPCNVHSGEGGRTLTVVSTCCTHRYVFVFRVAPWRCSICGLRAPCLERTALQLNSSQLSAADIMPPVQQWPRGPVNKLHHAASVGSTERINALLRSNDIDQGDPKGRSPLMLGAIKGYSHVVRILLNKGASILVVADSGYTALHLCAQNGHPAVTKMLLKAGADPEAATSDGNTPLILAAEGGHCEVMKALIDAGANLDSRRLDGRTSLFFAADRGHADAMEVLLDANANPQLAIKSTTNHVPLDAAAHHGHSAAVLELIQQVGIDGCGGASGGVEALRQASLKQHIDIMAMLADAGVVDTGKILNAAAGCGLEASMKFLLQQQKKEQGKTTGRVGYLNNTEGPFGATPLVSSSALCPSRSPRVVRQLIDAGADTTSTVLLLGPGGEMIFNDIPLAFTTRCLLEKTFVGKSFTEEELHRLEAIRRLLLRVEAVHAVSWLWPRDAVRAITRTAEGAIARVKTASMPLNMVSPILRRRVRRRGVLLAALFRYLEKS